MGVALQATLLYDASPVYGEAENRKTPVREEGDDALVSRACTGDFQAFEELVRRYRNDVFRLAHHFVRNREEAWDISQEVFIKAHRSLSHFRGEANVKTWLLRITANHCKDCFKKRRLQTVSFDDQRRVEVPSAILEPARVLEAQEIGNAIQDAFSRLSHKHRTVFVLREFEGLSYDEIARVMHCNLGTVMSRLHHARKRLQKELIHRGIVEERTHD